jgi:hypothetical protein
MAKRITFIAAASAGVSPTVQVGGSVAVDDLLLVVVTAQTTAATPSVSGGGAGTWVLRSGGAPSRQSIWSKRAAADAASAFITVSGGGANVSVAHAAFRGVREVTFLESIQVEAGGSKTSTATLPAPSQPWAWVVLCLSYGNSSGVTVTGQAATNPLALTQRAHSEGGNGGQTTADLSAAEQTSFAASCAFSWNNGAVPDDVVKTALYLLPQVELVADTRSFSLTGRAAQFVEFDKILAERGQYVLAGGNVGLVVGGRLTRASRGNPAWARDAHIGEVGGSLSKEDSKTEGQESAPAMWLREIRAMRGSLYTTKPATLVHIENVMMARFFGAVWSRTPEKFRANLSPARSDERLPYWVKFLSIPVQPSDPKQTIRARASAHYRIANGPTIAGIRSAVSDLLGDAFVDVVYTPGASLSAPPANTFWPGINPGPASHDLGNGTWTSPRAHIEVEVTRPPGMSEATFANLVNVQLHQLLDRMLPGRNTFAYDEV